MIASVEQQIREGTDRHLAVRLVLAQLYFTSNGDEIEQLTGDRPKLAPPSLAFVDGDRPRLVHEASVERATARDCIGRFLIDMVPLTPSWLQGRSATLARLRRDEVRRLEKMLADGQAPGALGEELPVVVVREAFRRRGSAREKLLVELLTGVPKPVRSRDKGEMLDCGLGALLVTPLGARFADHFLTNGAHGRGRNNSST